MMATPLFSEESAVPVPGKQVVQSVELPASTSTWVFGREGIGLIGEPRPLDESSTDTLRYWLFLPADYEAQAQSGGAPLLLFLHGAGERGDAPEDVDKVKVHGLPRLLDNPEFAKKFPCVTVSPQCKNDFAWSPAQLMLLLDHIEANYKIDKSRVYVTGLSMGGFGTWMCLNESPHRFAAAVPICGGAKPEWAERLVEIPIWVFHGDHDTVVTLDRSQTIVDVLRKTGGRKILFTVYEGVGHDSWTQTYDNPLLYDWMFQQTLKGTGVTADAQPSPMRESIIEMPIGDRNTFKMRTNRGNGTEDFSVVVHVAIRGSDERTFNRRYEQATIEIIDRIMMVLNASTIEERRVPGLTTIKERAKRTINEALGTPWVRDVFFTEIVHEIR
jgi:predicted esterase/flagellar basal body-associated protein FliL